MCINYRMLRIFVIRIGFLNFLPYPGEIAVQIIKPIISIRLDFAEHLSDMILKHSVSC